MFEVGAQVGAYTIVRRLGAGGMGEVYLARHRHIGRDAAIKVLLPDLSKSEDVVARFFTEARATAAIRHPGIVEIVDCDVHPSGRAYIVMEFLDGENLAERLERAGSYAGDMATAGSILLQVTSALSAAHAKGIVHRDLKPDNVFLCRRTVAGSAPLVKILDFGIAKLIVDDGHGRNKTRTGSLLGTPTYMSPEQCRGATSIDHRTDVYALGCMAFEMIAGRPPFVRAGSGEVLVAHLVERPPALASLVPGVVPALDALIAKMLEKDPADRPGSMGDVAAGVERALGIKLTPAIGVFAAEASAATYEAPMSQPHPSPSASPLPHVASGQGTMPHAGAAPLPVSGPAIAATLAAPAPGAAVVGGTRLMPTSRTTLGDTASEVRFAREVTGKVHARPPWVVPAAAAAGAAAVVLVVALALKGPSPQPAPARVARESAAPAPRPAPTPPPAAPDPPRPVVAPPAEVAIEISSEPPGAEVWLPGEETARGRTPLKIAVRRGDPAAQVTLKASGYKDAPVTLDPGTGEGEGGPINVVLEKVKRERKHGESNRAGKWVGPRDENDIYKPIAD